MSEKRLEDLLTRKLKQAQKRPTSQTFQGRFGVHRDVAREIVNRIRQRLTAEPQGIRWPNYMEVLDKYLNELAGILIERVPSSLPLDPLAVEKFVDHMVKSLAWRIGRAVAEACQTGDELSPFGDLSSSLISILEREKSLIATPFGGGHEGVAEAFDQGWGYTLGEVFDGVLDRLGGYDKIGPQAGVLIWNLVKSYEFMLRDQCRKVIQEWADREPGPTQPYVIWSKMDDWARTTGAAIALEHIRPMLRAAKSIPNL